MARSEGLQRSAAADGRAFYLQRSFRALLDAMARPGELADLPAEQERATADAGRSGLFATTVMVADVLLDAATRFAVASAPGTGDAEAERALSLRTHALVAEPGAAPYVILPLGVRGARAAAVVSGLTAGTLLDPHTGATCIVECASLVGVDGQGVRSGSAAGSFATSRVLLSGPGIKGTACLELDRGDVMAAREERGDEFPCGIDLVFVDKAGHVAAIPRSTRIEVRGEHGEEEARPWDM